jgi:hypothetical protein
MINNILNKIKDYAWIKNVNSKYPSTSRNIWYNIYWMFGGYKND